MTMIERFDGYVRPLFIETGTGFGNTLAYAATVFEKCISIEQNTKLYLAAEERFRDVPNVHLHNGMSPRILPVVIEPDTPTTFWLDAHYHGNGNTLAMEGGQCPLLEELRAIMRVNWQTKPIILIDDGFMFDDSMPHPGFTLPFWFSNDSGYDIYKRSDWPRIAEIDELLVGYHRTVVMDTVLEYRANETAA